MLEFTAQQSQPAGPKQLAQGCLPKGKDWLQFIYEEHICI